MRKLTLNISTPDPGIPGFLQDCCIVTLPIVVKAFVHFKGKLVVNINVKFGPYSYRILNSRALLTHFGKELTAIYCLIYCLIN